MAALRPGIPAGRLGRPAPDADTSSKMPLFRRKPANGETAAEPPKVADVGSEEEMLAAVAEQIARASGSDGSFCLLRVSAQVLPGTRISADELTVVADAILGQLREGDRAGRTGGDYLVILPDTTADRAMVAAQRLGTEVTMRSAAVNRRNWRVGVAAYPEDGIRPETLIDATRVAIQGRGRAA